MVSSQPTNPPAIAPSRLGRYCRVVRCFPVSHWRRSPYLASSDRPDEAPSASTIDQRLLQRFSSAMDPAHDRADGHIGDLGDLLVRESFDIGQQDGHPERVGQRLDGRLDVGVGEPLEGLVLGAPAQPGGLLAGQVAVEVQVLDVLHVGDLGTPLLRPVGVDVRVGEDPVEPGLQVGAQLEAGEGPVGLQVGLLHQVLGVRRVAGHPEGGRVERGHVLHREIGEHRLIGHACTLHSRERHVRHGSRVAGARAGHDGKRERPHAPQHRRAVAQRQSPAGDPQQPREQGGPGRPP